MIRFLMMLAVLVAAAVAVSPRDCQASPDAAYVEMIAAPAVDVVEIDDSSTPTCFLRGAARAVARAPGRVLKWIFRGGGRGG